MTAKISFKIKVEVINVRHITISTYFMTEH